MDRRQTIQWMLAAATVMPLRLVADAAQARPYGSDPDLQRIYHSGELWPLTLSPLQREQATVLCDTIVPRASRVGVVDFIDEWISAPYLSQREDRSRVLGCLAWLDAQSMRCFSQPMLRIATQQLHEICDAICYVPKAAPEHREAAQCFARFRDLTVGGFYTTPQGRSDLGYVGNTPLPRFTGPPLDVLKKVGLA